MTANKPIMIIEDALDIQTVVRKFLEAEGFPTLCARNGLEALELLRSAEDLPAVILLDLMMPGMNGYEFRTVQRRDPRLSRIPVVVMTADGHIDDKAAMIEAQGCIKKPMNIDQLLEVATRYCSQA
jgi:CheY-like chemotaxis protein